MAAYVLVGGAWLGGRCWQDVARPLRAGGHDVYPVTLTGLGERAHLADPEVDLDTRTINVANAIEFEDLREVVLVGHYARPTHRLCDALQQIGLAPVGAAGARAASRPDDAPRPHAPHVSARPRGYCLSGR